MPAKQRKILAPKVHHLDRHAETLLAVDRHVDDGEVLIPAEVATWLRVSEAWLAIGRHRGYGPEFIKYEDGRVTYRRGAVRVWLKSRAVSSIAEHRNA